MATKERPTTRNFFGMRELEENVWEATLDRIRHTYDLFDHVFVSFSAGKDSTVCLNATVVVAEELGKLPVRAVFFDEEAIPHETEAYARRVAADSRIALEWYCLPVQHRNACSHEEPLWWPWAPEARNLWVREMPEEAITDLPGFVYEPPEKRPSIPQCAELLAPPSMGSVGMILGIRADESASRRRAVTRRRHENYMPKELHGPNVRKVYPIYDWSTQDVWTAPAKFGWDYNEAYDVMEMAGISHHGQRCAPPYGEEPMQKLWTFKECFPDIWERMCYRVPGAATAARWSTTDLYSFGSVPDKPEGLTWEEFLTQRIQAHEPEAAAAIAHTVRSYIRGHYKKTSDPILFHTHPLTAISWRYLLQIADRGDFKSRHLPPYPRIQDLERITREYEAERAELEG